MPRKIVQIAVAAYVSSDGDSYVPTFALCDDGSVWRHYVDHRTGQQSWRPFPPIPQEKVPNK